MVSAMWRDSDQLKVDLIEIPVVLYTTEQIFLAQALVYFFRRWERKEEISAVSTV
jgi:solute carrier family 10 (sodium/bile acid cotransporter), member 7